MVGQVDFPVRTFQASAAIAQYLRVKLSSGKLAAAGAGEVCIGTMDAPALVADAYYGVRAWNAPGTRFMVAAGAITQYAAVYGAASGKIDDTVNGRCIGIALEAATADGDVIEVLPMTALQGAVAAAAAIADAETAHATATTGDLDALGTKINAIIAVLENAGLVLTS